MLQDVRKMESLAINLHKLCEYYNSWPFQGIFRRLLLKFDCYGTYGAGDGSILFKEENAQLDVDTSREYAASFVLTKLGGDTNCFNGVKMKCMDDVDAIENRSTVPSSGATGVVSYAYSSAYIILLTLVCRDAKKWARENYPNLGKIY